MLMIPILCRNPAGISAKMSQFPKADGFEIWLDQFSNITQKETEHWCRVWRKKTLKKLLIVCKDKEEGGRFQGSTSEKIDLLIAAAKGGADFIDMRHDTALSLLKKLQKNLSKTKLILSFHDFQKTPSLRPLRNIFPRYARHPATPAVCGAGSLSAVSLWKHHKAQETFSSLAEQDPRKEFRRGLSLSFLKTLAERMIKKGADIVKIACMVNHMEDNETLIELAMNLTKKKIPHIVIGMGKKGIMTRVFSEKMGNVMTFVNGEKKTAAGQLVFQDMLHLRRLLKST